MLVTHSGPTPELSRRLPQEFATLSEHGQTLIRLGDQVTDDGIEQLRAQAVQSRDSVLWLMIALIPTAILLIASFTFLIARPITPGEREHPQPGRGPVRASPSRSKGPATWCGWASSSTGCAGGS